MLYTNLKHIETVAEHSQAINNSENVIIVCGRMDFKSITTYRIAEELERTYYDVNFFDMEIDNPNTLTIQNLNKNNVKQQTPFICIYKKSKKIKTISGIDSKEDFIEILNYQFRTSIKTL